MYQFIIPLPDPNKRYSPLLPTFEPSKSEQMGPSSASWVDVLNLILNMSILATMGFMALIFYDWHRRCVAAIQDAVDYVNYLTEFIVPVLWQTRSGSGPQQAPPNTPERSTVFEPSDPPPAYVSLECDANSHGLGKKVLKVDKKSGRRWLQFERALQREERRRRQRVFVQNVFDVVQPVFDELWENVYMSDGDLD